MRERIVLNNGEYQIVDYEVGNKPYNLVIEIPDHSKSSFHYPATTTYYLHETNVTIKWCREWIYSFPYYAIAFSEKYQTDIEFVWGNHSKENIVDRVLALIKKYKSMDNNKIMEGCIISLKKEIEEIRKKSSKSDTEKSERISELTEKNIEICKEIDSLKEALKAKTEELGELKNNIKSVINKFNIIE